MPESVATILGLIATVVVMVLLYMKVLPKKMNGHLENKFLQWVHDYFQFKRLYIEDIIKFLFTLGTVACICFGFFLMFTVSQGWYGDTSNFATGLGVLILGPIVLRVLYELQMIVIIAVHNIMDINNKMDGIILKNQESNAVEQDIQE